MPWTMQKYGTKERLAGVSARWGLVGIGALLLILATIAYPAPWNSAMQKMQETVGFRFPFVPEIPFTLGLDLQGGAHLVYEADMSAIPLGERGEALSGVRDVIERRVNAFGVGEPVVQTVMRDDSYRVLVDLPGMQDVSSAVREIGETPVLEFKIPDEDIDFTASPEQEAQIATAQEVERAEALKILDRALEGEDFATLAAEVSIDDATKASAGYIGFVTEEDSEYGGLITRIREDGLRTGVIDGLYEGTSRMHIMRYISRKDEQQPRISHILICYAGAPSCTNERTKEEALALAQEVQAEATTRNFADLAKEHSSDVGSVEAGGDLGFVPRGVMVAPFEEAAYALRTGRISDVVESQFGYHILYRSESQNVRSYELAHIEMPWTTLSDVFVIDPWANTALSGKHIRRASVSFDPNTGVPYVLLDFNPEGAQLFGELTAANVGAVIGIFLDGEAITTPVVQQAIYGGQATITGDFTTEEAKLLSQRLNAGALPVPISVIEQQTIGPSLGATSLELSITAAVIGFFLVVLFMVLYYRLPGLFAAIALVFYAVLNLALYKLFGVTMTLSGIAGLVFSFGIAVDANVLIFERLKEELRLGRDVPTAVSEAFRRAWPSIRDGNITTLIATSVLYLMSTGFIRGFALTLTVGVLASMFSAMIVTRVLLEVVVRVKFLRSPVFFLGYPREKR